MTLGIFDAKIKMDIDLLYKNYEVLVDDLEIKPVLN
jgi:hypothetical protein